MFKDRLLFLSYGCFTRGQFERRINRILDRWREAGGHVVNGLCVETAEEGDDLFNVYPMLNNPKVTDYYLNRMRHPWTFLCPSGKLAQLYLTKTEALEKAATFGAIIHVDDMRWNIFINRV